MAEAGRVPAYVSVRRSLMYQSMDQTSLAHTPTVSLVTPTWSGDLDHYRVLLRSLENKSLSGLKHTTVVQTEDLALFSGLLAASAGPVATQLCTSEQVLPAEVELARCQALRYQKIWGRHVTRLCGSASRVLGGPNWPRYTGWHTQQISKLAMVAQADTDYVLVIDSDVIVTPAADLSTMLSDNGIICFSDRKPLTQFKGKTRKWVLQADGILRVPSDPQREYDSYFDTPFLLHVATVRAMFAWLENEYRQPWWRVLLAQSPRHWSEFAIYKLFLQKNSDEHPETVVRWLAPSMMRYIFDTRDTVKLLSELQQYWQDPAIHFITVHSQSSGRQRWRAHEFVEEFLAMINNSNPI